MACMPDTIADAFIVLSTATCPPHPRPTLSMRSLGTGLFDAAVIHVGRAAPGDLVNWLGLDTTARLAFMLRGFQANEPLRGHDPLKAPSKTCAFLYNALRGGPTALDLAAQSPRHGGELGLAKHRVVCS